MPRSKHRRAGKARPRKPEPTTATTVAVLLLPDGQMVPVGEWSGEVEDMPAELGALRDEHGLRHVHGEVTKSGRLRTGAGRKRAAPRPPMDST